MHAQLSPTDLDDSDSQLDDLIASLTDLDISSLTASSSPPLLRDTSPNDRAATPPQPITHSYKFHSPSKSGCTTDWSEVSYATQSVAGGHVHAVRKPSSSPRPKNTSYAVFFGRNPGTYSQWYGPGGAESQIKRVSAAVYQGYPTLAEAAAAFRYAHAKNWTGHRTSRPSSPSQQIPAATVASLPKPLPPNASASRGENPLRGCDNTPTKWHVVYAGITPGIYESYLECALNTLGLSSTSYDSTPSHVQAQEWWDVAVAKGHVRILTHTYSSVARSA